MRFHSHNALHYQQILRIFRRCRRSSLFRIVQILLFTNSLIFLVGERAKGLTDHFLACVVECASQVDVAVVVPGWTNGSSRVLGVTVQLFG